MAVTAYRHPRASDLTARGSGDYVRFRCDTEAELPSANVQNGDTAYTLDSKKMWDREGGAWVERGDASNTGGGVVPKYLEIPFHADGSAALTLTNQANAEQFLGNSDRNIKKIDLSNFTQVRLLARVVTGSASANTPRIYAEYHTSFTTTVGTYSGIGSSAVNCSLTSTGLIDSGWINLVAGAKADVFVTILMNGGDAAADPALGQVALQFK